MTSQANQDDEIAALLQAVGPRAEPDDEVRARVYDAVLNEWEDLPAEQAPPSRRWHRSLWAMAASVLLVGTVLFTGLVDLSGPTQVASVTYSRGSQLTAQTPVFSNQVIRTAAGEYVSLRLQSGVLLGLDADSVLSVHDQRLVTLNRGRVYVDAAEGQMRLLTPHLQIVDIGTIYQVQTDSEHSRVWMREGQAELAYGAEQLAVSSAAGSGDYVQVSAQGVLIEQGVVATTDQLWSWHQAARAPLELNGQTVYDFVQWAARDSGMQVRVSSPLVGQMAAMEQLQASPGQTSEHYTVEEALETTGFTVTEQDKHTWVLAFKN